MFQTFSKMANPECQTCALAFLLRTRQLLFCYSWAAVRVCVRKRRRVKCGSWHVWWEIMTDCISTARPRGRSALDLNVFFWRAEHAFILEYTHAPKIKDINMHRLALPSYALSAYAARTRAVIYVCSRVWVCCTSLMRNCSWRTAAPLSCWQWQSTPGRPRLMTSQS